MTTDLQATTPTAHERQIHRTLLLAWGVYLTMAPVAWFPGIPQSAYTGVKTLAFVSAVVSTWLYARNRRVPGGLTGPVGLALVAASSIFGLAQAASTTAALRSLLEVTLAFGVLWTVYVFERNVAPIWPALAAAAVAHGVLSLLVLAAFAGWFEAVSPLRPDSIVDTGLGGWRTGWSNGVALFIPFGLIPVFRPGPLVMRIGVAAAVASTVLGQLVTGGRAGVVVALLSILLMLTFTQGLAGLVVGAVAVIGVAVALTSGAATGVGIDRFEQPLGSDETTATRLELVQFGWDQFGEQPLTGHGIGIPVLGTVAGEQLEIHNVWLRLAAEGGILLAASMIAVTVSIIAKAVDVLWRAAKGYTSTDVPAASAFVSCLLGGVVVSLIEPNIFLGTMHVSIVWWVAAGAAVAMHAGGRTHGPQR